MIRNRNSSLTLRVYTLLWVFLPVTVVTIAILVVGALVLERILADLLIDRHRQIASSAAVGISEVVEGYALILEALAANPDVLSPATDRRQTALSSASDALAVFDAGVAVFDEHSLEMASSGGGGRLAALAAPARLLAQQVQEMQAPVFSQLVGGQAGAPAYILVGAPVRDPAGASRGVLVGAVSPGAAAFSQPIRRLAVGVDGFAYLVDAHGKVIFHPDSSQIGADYSTQPVYQQAAAGRNTALLWKSSSGERFFEANASVAATGWALIVQETWNSAISPIRPYAFAIIFALVVVILFVVWVAWQGLQRISTPIRLLGEQTERLSHGEPLQAYRQTHVRELDDLQLAIDAMARQITAFRAGLHRYIEALTQSQENERRRISRELHDETIQNLLAVSRQLELAGLSEDDPAKLERLKELQHVISETLKGIRRVIGDLRPLMLEDLGLVPALKALVRLLRDGPQGVPHVQFEMSGEPDGLSPEYELAIYRVTQEALNNVRKHAGATGVRVHLEFRPERVVLEVEDNGQGFHVPDPISVFSQTGNFGLMGIQERVWALGGSFSIQSAPDQGTRLRLEAPRQHPPETDPP